MLSHNSWSHGLVVVLQAGRHSARGVLDYWVSRAINVVGVILVKRRLREMRYEVRTKSDVCVCDGVCFQVAGECSGLLLAWFYLCTGHGKQLFFP